MLERPFLNQLNKPTDQTLQTALGSTYIFYTQIIALAAAYAKAWTFTKSSGWMLKIFNQKKALLYFIPLNDGFKIGLTIRADERVIFLTDDQLAVIHDQVLSSKKYPEGFALQFDISNKNEFQVLELFLKKLVLIRE